MTIPIGPAEVIFNHVERSIIIDAPYVTVEVHADERSLHVIWRNFAPSGTYRCTLNKAVERIAEDGLLYFLTDQRRRGPILNDDEVWLVTDWCPRMAATALQRAAIVQSPDFFNRSTLERVVEAVRASAPFPIRFFSTLEEAQHWLLTGEERPLAVVVD